MVLAIPRLVELLLLVVRSMLRQKFEFVLSFPLWTKNLVVGVVDLHVSAAQGLLRDYEDDHVCEVCVI